MLHHLAVYKIGSQATVLQDKFVVLCSQISWTFIWSCFWGNSFWRSGHGVGVLCTAEVDVLKDEEEDLHAMLMGQWKFKMY